MEAPHSSEVRSAQALGETLSTVIVRLALVLSLLKATEGYGQYEFGPIMLRWETHYGGSTTQENK